MKIKIFYRYFWNGGTETIFFNRDLGKTYENYFLKFSKKNLSKIFSANNNKSKNLKVFIPTNFMFFDFIDEYYKTDKIFINREK